MSRVRIPSSTPFLSSNHHFSYAMKHGDFLCFVTRIVEKIVEKLCDVLSSKQPVFTNLRRKTLSVADIVPTGTNGDEPMQAGPHPRTTAIGSSIKDCELKHTAVFRVFHLKSWKIVENGPIAPFDATGPGTYAGS